MAFRINNIGGAIIAFFMAYAEGLLSRESGIERLEGPGLCKPRAAGGSRDRGGPLHRPSGWPARRRPGATLPTGSRSKLKGGLDDAVEAS